MSIISFICHLYQKIFDLFCFLETHLEVWRVSIACSLDGAVEAVHLSIFLSFFLFNIKIVTFLVSTSILLFTRTRRPFLQIHCSWGGEAYVLSGE